MDSRDTIIQALCNEIERKDKYIRQLEDAVVYQRRIINKEDSNENTRSNKFND